VDDIKMNLRETEYGGMDWIHLAFDMDQRKVLMNMVMKLRVA
jgi:hypothetical protein